MCQQTKKIKIYLTCEYHSERFSSFLNSNPNRVCFFGPPLDSSRVFSSIFLSLLLVSFFSCKENCFPSKQKIKCQSIVIICTFSNFLAGKSFLTGATEVDLFSVVVFGFHSDPVVALNVAFKLSNSLTAKSISALR